MRLLNLELENWSCHGNLALDLSQGVQIEGRNGSGKTSILEAIRFIFAESAHGYKTKVKNGQRSARVTLSFTKDGNNYSIEKELFIDKPSTARMLCNDTLVGDNPSSVYKSMQNILDENILDKLLYIPQGGLTTIVESLTRKEGRKELDSLFGLEKFDKIYKDSAEDIKEAKMKLEFMLEQLAKHPKEASREYAEEMKKLEDEKAKLEAEVKGHRQESGKLDIEIKKTDSGIKGIEELKRKLDKLKDEIKTIDVELAKKTSDLENVKQRLESMSKTNDELKSLQEKEAQTKKYGEITELLLKLERLKEKQESLKVEKDRERLNAIEKELSQRPEVERKHSKAEASLKEMEGLKAALAHDLKQQETRLKELEGLEGEAKCPRCGQTLSPEHLSGEKALNAEAIEKLKNSLKELDERLNVEREEHKQLKNTLSKLEKTAAEAEYLKTEVDKKSMEGKSITDEAREVEKNLAEAGYQDENPDFVQQKAKEHAKTKERVEFLKEELKQKDALEERRKKVGDEIGRTTSQKNEKQKALEQLKYSEDELNQLRQRKDELTEKKYSIENEADKKQYRANEIKSKEEDVGRKLDEYEKLKATMEGREKEIKLLTQAREIFHTDKGIQKYLRDRYINQLNNLLTYYFKRINENPRYSEIVFDQNYEIQIKTIDGVMGMDQLSGGEKIQLAITLRIALTEMLSHARLLMLDEPFGSLDRNHREILGETLSKIASNGQLILVTHVHVDSLQLERIELQGY